MAADAVTRKPRREKMSTSFTLDARAGRRDDSTEFEQGLFVSQHLHIFSGTDFDYVMNVVLPPFSRGAGLWPIG